MASKELATPVSACSLLVAIGFQPTPLEPAIAQPWTLSRPRFHGRHGQGTQHLRADVPGLLSYEPSGWSFGD